MSNSRGSVENGWCVRLSVLSQPKVVLVKESLQCSLPPPPRRRFTQTHNKIGSRSTTATKMRSTPCGGAHTMCAEQAAESPRTGVAACSGAGVGGAYRPRRNQARNNSTSSQSSLAMLNAMTRPSKTTAATIRLIISFSKWGCGRGPEPPQITLRRLRAWPCGWPSARWPGLRLAPGPRSARGPRQSPG